MGLHFPHQSRAFGSRTRLHCATMAVATCMMLACFVMLTLDALQPPPTKPSKPAKPAKPPTPEPTLTPIKVPGVEYPEEDVCLDWRDSSINLPVWNKAMKMSSKLMENKFTVAIQTYRRPDRLNATIHKLINHDIPSLHEIVIVWNDLEAETPPDFVADNNVTVRYRKSKRNSLNAKLWVDPLYKTKAVLLHDDDVYYEPEDLEFVFQTWRQQGQDRITGAFARCAHWTGSDWTYDLCGGDKSAYALVLTGLAFVHISILEYWSSDDPFMTRIRNYVDEKFNCEDIGLNFIASWLTCRPPLQVSGPKKPVNTFPSVGLSNNGGHFETRAKCVNDFFAEFHGYMPLRNSTEYIRRGLIEG